MSTKRRTVPGSDRQAGRAGAGITRRGFVAGSSALLAAVAWPRIARADALPTEALEESGFVYVSPLRSDGRESACHGEVWFAWLDDAVQLVTSRDSWKARAQAKGLDRARIWVGDHGRVGGEVGEDAPFRRAPQFDARVSASTSGDLLDRILARYREKYPAEIGKWEPRFRKGLADGSRVILTYTPSGGAV